MFLHLLAFMFMLSTPCKGNIQLTDDTALTLHRRFNDIMDIGQQTTDVTKALKRMTASIKALRNHIDALHKENVLESASDCSELSKLGITKSGVYPISVYHNCRRRIVQVYCEFHIDGGWTRIQHRQDGSVDFYRNWADYKNGFGNVSGEHWLGNENIHDMTSQRSYNLQVILETWKGYKYYAEYKSFKIDNEGSLYRLHISGFHGTAGDSMAFHNNMYFSTKDRDNDKWSSHCSQYWHGAWWYGRCLVSNLNGEYWTNGKCAYTATPRCIMWQTHFGNKTPYRQVSMLIRDPYVK